MLLSRVSDAEQGLDVSHGFAAEYLELVLEFQGGYVAGRDPSKVSLDQAPRFGWKSCVACCYVQSGRRMNQFQDVFGSSWNFPMMNFMLYGVPRSVSKAVANVLE